MSKFKNMKARPYTEIFRDEEQGFRYRIKGANHEIMVTSESYTKISDAADGLFALVTVVNKFRKWYDRDDDSWLFDLTKETTDQAAVRVLGGLPAHERASE